MLVSLRKRLASQRLLKILTTTEFTSELTSPPNYSTNTRHATMEKKTGKSVSERFINDENLRRQPSQIRELTKLWAESPNDTIFMAGGFPNPTLFPFSSISVTLDDGQNTVLDFSGEELRQSLQYQPTLGFHPFVAELKKFVEHYHAPPQGWDNTDLIVTCGSQNALAVALEMTRNVGDPVVIPEPCYTATMGILQPYKPVFITAGEDAYGMQPESLRAVLKSWYKSVNATPGSQLFNDRNFKRPKILYVNPTGGNPSGSVIPLERKKEIYRIAQEYDLLILEDDPYYFLHFLQENPTSFLKLDVDGRVIRLDSFSKVLSSGLRVGFAIGPKDFIRKMELYLQATILHASSLSQVLANGILQKWGVDGFTKHTDRVKALYRRRRDIMIAAMEKHLTGLAHWDVPQGGMFIWMKIKGVPDTREMIMERGIQNKILSLPGNVFMADQKAPCAFVRVAFSVIPEEQIEEAIIRMAALIKAEQKSK